MKKFFMLIVVLSLLKHTCFAQKQYTITNYAQEQGLPFGAIRGIYKDTTGFIWITSEGGVSRFDGYNFKTFRHNPDDSTSLPKGYFLWNGILPEYGDIYFGTEHGYCLFNPASQSFTSRLPCGDSIKIFRIAKSEGVKDCYWLASKFALFRISKNGSERFALPHHISYQWRMIPSTNNCVVLYNSVSKDSLLYFDYQSKVFSKTKILNRMGMEDSSSILEVIFTGNNYYLFTSNSLYRFDSTAKSFVWHLDLKRTRNFNYEFSPYLTYNDTLVVIGSKSGYLNIFNIRTGEEKLVYVNKKIPEEELNDRGIYAIVKDNNGGIWMGTNSMGLIHYNLLTGESEQYIHEPGNINSLPNNLIYNLLTDENGVVWAGCIGHGLIKMEPITALFEIAVPAKTKKSSASVQGGFSENIRGFLETDDGYWIATLDGLFSYSKQTQQFSNQTSLVPLKYRNNNDNNAEGSNASFGSLAKDHAGNLWIGTWIGELFIYNVKLNHVFPLSRPRPIWDIDKDGCFRNLYCDSKNRMWISSQNAGVCMVDCNALNLENINATKFEYNFFDEKDSSSLLPVMAFVVTEDAQGTIWAGTENGLCRYNEQTKKWKRYYNIPGNKNSIHNSNVRSLCLDKKGTLWIGTNGGGLNRYDKEQDNFTHFTTENGLADDQIYTLVCDNNGMLWMGTNQGLCRFNPLDYSCKNFIEKDGIQNYEYNTNAAIKLKDGTLLFGGVAGYNIIDPHKIGDKKSKPPAVAITSVKVFDRETPFGDNIIKLNYNENNLAFEFVMLSYFHNQENHYAYKLEGIDHDWIYSDTRRFVSYPKLEPGDYTFKVKACNSDGVWNETGAQLQITITPPWWKTNWARTLFVLIAIGIIIAYYRYRTHALRMNQKMLQSEVSKATIELRKKNDEVEKKNQELLLTMENLKSTQEQLLQSEKMAAFGTMAKRMSHEIQNPMNFVNNFSALSKQLMEDVLNENATEQEKQEAMILLNGNLEKILYHGQRASAIIQQMQAHHRSGTTHDFFKENET
nr:hypothetical protein [Bacteroidota bacterium]